MREVIGDLERRLDFEPGHHGGRKGQADVEHWGVGSMNLRFLLIGPKGATQFLLYSGWYLPETWEWWNERGVASLGSDRPREVAADLGYHAYEPQYTGQNRMGRCAVLADAEGGCFYNGSSLNAELVWDRFLRHGEEALWAELWSYYEEVFGDKRQVDPRRKTNRPTRGG